ncbi:DUF998 domain-containing protein [Microbacterium sp.]|uniref:DUF998 domain-containing protein n=1 Tax=Microbacterium sp. TaxID=51671 RepID=UPI002FE087C0
MSSAKRTSLTLTGALLLLAGIIAATLTTTEPEWWELYFSRLGMTGDFSAMLFNGGAIMGGISIASGGVMMRIWFLRSPLIATKAHRRAARVIPFFGVTLGLSLAGIGVFPLSVDKLAHDISSNGMIVSFLSLLIAHRIYLRSLSRLLSVLAIITGSALVLSLGAMSFGLINLTVFEAIGFTAILSWVHLLETHVRSLATALEPRRTANSQQISLSPIWGTSKMALVSEA